MTDKLHFIKAQCHQSSRQQGYQIAPDHIKEKYDFEVSFNDSIVDLINKKIELSKGYQTLYEHISKIQEKVITIGGDHSISASTIAATNERYMRQNGEQISSDLIVLWIDAFPDLHDFNTSPNKDLNDMPAASLLGLCGTSFTKNKLLLKPDQLVYFGLNENDDNLELVNEYNIPNLTSKKINSIGIDNSINAIKQMIQNKPVHVTLDMKVFNHDITQSVVPVNKSGLTLECVEKLLVSLKNNIVALDVSEFNPCIGNPESVRITREAIRYLLARLFDLKEKSINIFNEDSHFLIYRPVQQESPYADIGWYILKGIDLATRHEILNQMDDDEIKEIDIEGEDYIITKTTMNEQYEKSYYTAKTINDTTLFPEEKLVMCFELLNVS
jgi:arginase family enzyme